MRAQSITGDVIATVTDSTGAIIPGASVVLTEIDTGQVLQLVSDDNGLAIFSQLKPGRYKLVATKDGFSKTVLSGVRVVLGRRLDMDVTLKAGDVTSTVNVSAEGASLLNGESSAIGQGVSKTRIEELPLNGRNFLQLTQLTAGATPVGAGNSPATTWTGRTDTTISFAGLRESDTSYLLNGIETRNGRFGNTGISPSVDAIEEFRVQRTTFGAEFGHSAAIVNTTLLGGVNDYHLAAFELNRNKALAADEYFAKQSGETQPALNQNNFGATLSGPVAIPHFYNGHDKTFFMFNFEGLRIIQGNPVSGLYPSAAQLAGNLADNSAGTGIFPCEGSVTTNCVNIINPQTGTPFPGNVIPESQIDATAKKAIAYIPTPNTPLTSTNQNTFATPKIIRSTNQYNTRVDQRLSSRDNLYATWSNSNDNLYTPAINPLGGNNTPLNDHLWTVTYTHAFSAKLFNEFRFGVNDSATFKQAETAFGPNYTESLFGLSYGNNTDPSTFGIPTFAVAGYGPIGSITEAIGADDKNYQYTDNLSLNHGRLSILAGMQFIHERFTQITDFGSNPNLTYKQGYSGSTLSDFLLGEPYQITGATGDSTQHLHTNFYGPYIQNNWKVRPDLTLNLGIRYEFAGSPIESNNRSQYFDAATNTFLYAGQGIRRSVVNPDYNNFAPRIGFAYRPSFVRNSVIRGGVGTYYATDNFNEEQFLNQGSPFYLSRSNNPSTITPVSISNPFGDSTVTFPPPNANIFTLDKNSRTSYINQWGLAVEREFGGTYLVELEYAGGSGQKLAQRRNLNIGAINPTSTTITGQLDPNYGFILQSSDYGRSNYNAFTAKVDKRFSSGSSFLAAYTYQKAIDIGITDDFSALSRDFFTYDRGVSDYDVPQRFVISYIYQLPFGRGRQYLSNASRALDTVIGDWQLNGITTFTAGQYSTPVLQGDNLHIGSFSTSRPNKVGDPKEGQDARKFWFNPAAYAIPSTFVPGSAGRNSIEMPGYDNWDMSLFKAIQIKERANFQLRFETFNTFNHTQFGFADTTLGDKSFGQISTTRPNSYRIVQLGGRVQF
jgi:hypothetical protein